MKLLANPILNGGAAASFPGNSVVKNLPANTEDSGLTLVLEDHLEEEMATHSSILAWQIPWTEEPGKLQSRGCKESDTTKCLLNYSLFCLKSHPLAPYSLEQRLANYSLQAKFCLPAFLNAVLLVHSHVHLYVFSTAALALQ